MTSTTRLTLSCLACAAIAGGGGYWLGQSTGGVSDGAAGGGAGGAAAGGGAGDSTGATDAAGGAEPIPVATARVVTGELADRGSAFGIVQPLPAATRTYSVPYEGAVQTVAVAPGQRVTAGATLAVLGASADTQLQYQQAQNALAAAQETLKQTRRRVTEQLATNTELASAEQAVKTAQTQMASLKARGANGPRTVTADVAGIVDQVNIQPGQIAAAGTALMTVRPEHEVEVKLGVSPFRVASLKPDQAVLLKVIAPASAGPALDPESGQPEQVAGKVRFVSPQVNAQSRLVDVYVSVAADATLTQGTYVTGSWTVRSVRGLIVPRDATRQVDGAWCVFVMADGKARLCPVALGVQQDDRVQVSGELTAGEEVITTTNGELDDGAAVTTEAGAGEASAGTDPSDAAAASDANPSSDAPQPSESTLPGGTPAGGTRAGGTRAGGTQAGGTRAGGAQ